MSVTLVHCGQTVRRITMKLGMQLGLGHGHIVLDEDTGPRPQRDTAPNFRPISVAAKWLHVSRCHLVWRKGLGRDDFVLHGDPAPPSQKGAEAIPKFSAHVYCGQTAGWINMVLSTEVGLSPDDFLLDEDPATPFPNRGPSPSPKFPVHFYCGQTVGCTKMPLGTELSLSPGDFMLDGDPALPKKGTEPPNFRPMFIVAKRLDGSRWHLA